jgi:hypothetical protein
MHAPERDWALVAPWWKWRPDAKDTASGRLTRPVIQKYETSDLVNAFLKDPQRCLAYSDEDLVQTVDKVHDVPTTGLRARIFGAEQEAPGTFFRRRRRPLEPRVRKIFLPTHKRFYLVVCQVHCDAPGFPRVNRARVCEVGFVVRRRTTDVPAAGVKEAKKILGGIAQERARIGVIDERMPGLKLMVAKQRTEPGLGPSLALGEAKVDALVKQRGFVLQLLGAERARLADWATRLHVKPSLQGWFPTDKKLDGVGTWQEVAEAPSQLGEEMTFPMYPLIPPAANKQHAGQFGTLYFGLLPAYLADHDPQGRPRFDDHEFYEARCFVRRHHEPHDRNAQCFCPDALFWSAPTEPYRLASHYDLAGTSHRPVTIQLPDLNDLAAQTAPVAGATFQKPAGWRSVVVQDQKASGGGDADQICSLPIPLITIVAMFVLELFLPVVVFVFGLWWMLLLRFCFPPHIKVATGVTAELDVNMKASDEDALEIDGTKLSVLADAIVNDVVQDSDAQTTIKRSYSPIAIANWKVGLANVSPPDATAGVDYETEVIHP